MRTLSLILATALCACTGANSGTGPGDDDTTGGDDQSSDGGPAADPDGGVGGGPDQPQPPQDPTYASAHPRIYLATNKDRLVASLAANVPAATAFKQMVDSQLAGANLWAFEPWFAALMGQLTGNATYCTYAVSQSDAYVAGEEAKISAGNRSSISDDSYLYVGENIGSLMLTYDWCNSSLSASQKTRWTALAAQAVWNVWHPSQASWGGHSFPWSGWATNDPSDNYYYSFMRATMLFGLAAHDEHPDAKGWLDFFRVTKFQNELVPTFNAELEGGGSREGTGYGVSMQHLWELYDLWQGSTGEDLARQTLHTRASLLYEIHAIVPTRDRIAPTGDHARDATAALFDYHRAYIEELAYLFADDPVAPRAKWYIDNSSVPVMVHGYTQVYDFLYGQPDMTAQPMGGMGRAYFASGPGELFARSSWDTDATWINLIAGPYTQSHAHHDQGALMLFKGNWLAYDANVESHSGINQDEENHNLVRIVSGGATVRQHTGTTSEVTALHRGDNWLHVASNLLPAYDGQSAVSKDEREVVFLEPDTVVVFDRVTTAAGAQQVWQLNSPNQPTVSGATATFASSGHDLTVRRSAPAGATSSVHNWAGGEYGAGYRLDETNTGGAQQHLHVLSVDGAVTSAVRDDADGRIGTTITFADGHTTTVRFSPTGVDGLLQQSGQSPVKLSLGVDNLPQ